MTNTALAVDLNAEIAAFERKQLEQLSAVVTGGEYIVDLRSCGNPDHFQDPDESMYGVPEIRAHVASFKEASALCRKYIEIFDIGGGNWIGGEIVRVADNVVIGRVSYNGRIWAADGSEILS